jgi:hypothetical protein
MRASFRALPARTSSADQPPAEKPARILWRLNPTAEALSISPRLLQKLTADGLVPCVRLRGCVRYYLPAVEAALVKLASGISAATAGE